MLVTQDELLDGFDRLFVEKRLISIVVILVQSPHFQNKACRLLLLFGQNLLSISTI